MKKFTQTLITLLTIVIGMSLTSCDDEMIADNLEGTWEGDMYSAESWGGHLYDATYTDIEFSLNPFSFKSGKGYWVDHYNNHPWSSNSYIANHMTWHVADRVIYIHLVEDNVDMEIRNYSLTDNHFRGQIYYQSNTSAGTREFSLTHTSSPNWDSYDYDDDYYYDYSYSKSSGADSTSQAKGASVTTKERPKHVFHMK